MVLLIGLLLVIIVVVRCNILKVLIRLIVIVFLKVVRLCVFFDDRMWCVGVMFV